MEVHSQLDSIRSSSRAQAVTLWNGYPFSIIAMPQNSADIMPSIRNVQEEHNGVSFRYRIISRYGMVGNC